MHIFSKDNVENVEKCTESYVLYHTKQKEKKLNPNDTKVQFLLFLKKHPFVRRVVRFFEFVFDYLVYVISGRDVFVEETTILFSASDGKCYSGNSKAVYEEMLGDNRFKSYRFVWLFNEPEKYFFLLNNPNTYIVENSKKNFNEITHEAKYWLFDFQLSPYVYPKRNQVYIQLGHGNPVKKSGYSVKFSGNPMRGSREFKTGYFFDSKKINILVSPSNFACRRFKAEYNLEKIHREEIVREIGTPKTDYLCLMKNNIDVNSIKDALGIKDKNKKVVLYAPAYRDDQYDFLTGYTFKNQLDFDYLLDKHEDDYIFIYRPHFDMASKFDFDKFNGFVYDGTAIDDINYLYLVSDILITDYSTAMFEFALLGKPMIHYLYDYKHYSKMVRPLYFNTAELPGIVAKSIDEVGTALKALSLLPNNDSVEKSYQDFNKKFNYKCDGLSSKRVADIIINEMWDEI